MKKRILWVGLSFLLVASLVLASCAEAAPGEQEEEEEEEEEELEWVEGAGGMMVPEPGVPVYGGTVTWLANWIQIEAETVGIKFDMADHAATRCYHDAYIENLYTPADIEKYGPRGTGEWDYLGTNLVPEMYCGNGLATSWEVYADKQIWHLREGVMWTGNELIGMEPREFTAYDAEFAINRWLTHPEAFVKESFFDEAVATDKYTLQVNTNRFDPAVTIWHYVFFGIQPEEVVDADAHDWRHQTGTGPFILTNYVEDSALTYKRNPNYWDTTFIDGVEYEIPFIDKLVLPIMLDESTQIAAIRTGELDYIARVFMKYKDTLETSCPDLLMGKYIFDNEIKMPLRCDRPPFDKVEVRRAMYQATDLQTVAEAVYTEGELYSYPTSSAGGAWTPPEERSAIAQKLYDYDPVEAKRMLADAGYPDGFDVTLSLPAGEIEFEDIGAMIVDMWAKVGVTVTLNVVETAALHSAVGAYDYGDAYLSGWGGTPDILSHVGRLTDEGSANRVLLQDPYIDEKYVEAASTIDYAERVALAIPLNLYALEQAPMIGFCSPIGFHVWWPWLRNYWGELDAGHLNPIPMIARLWVDEDMKDDLGF